MDEILRVPLGVVAPGCAYRQCWWRGGQRDDVPLQDLPHLRFAVQDTAKMIEIGHQVRDAFFVICTCAGQRGQIWNK